MNIDSLIVGDGLLGLMLAKTLHPSTVLVVGAPGGEDPAAVSEDFPSQSWFSQGILHCGTKYVLEDCTPQEIPDGRKDIDRWLQLSLGRRIALRYAANRMYVLSRGAYSPRGIAYLPPDPCVSFELKPHIGSRAYAESVIDVRYLLMSLRADMRNRTVRLPVTKTDAGKIMVGGVIVSPRRVFLCAGRNNALLWQELVGGIEPVQQVRPLAVLQATSAALPVVNAHLMVDDEFRLTVTSSRDALGRVTWSMGGPMLDGGVRDVADVAAVVQDFFELPSEFQHILRVYTIDRAERFAGGRRQLRPEFVQHGAVRAAWPCKLVFIPRLVEMLLAT